MAPVSLDDAVAAPASTAATITALKSQQQASAVSNAYASLKLQREPLVYSGSLDKYEYFEVTPVIGREYTNLSLKELLNAPNSDALLRDLAIVTSQRGVCFFRDQHDLDIESQKQLTDSVGRLAGRPAGHGLHAQPLFYSPQNSAINDKGDKDPFVYVINSKTQAKLFAHTKKSALEEPLGSYQWHSDGMFENCPNDYSCLKMEVNPTTGGDTMWADGGTVYEKMSPSWQRYMETLTAECGQKAFKAATAGGDFPMYSPRGSPDNNDDEFHPTHPVVRTNPVTGTKSLYTFGLHCAKINDVTPIEDRIIREYILKILTESHDLQVRFKWQKASVALWDNRSTLHAATPDVSRIGGKRQGNRASSTGERSFFDPKSLSKTQMAEFLASKGVQAL